RDDGGGAPPRVDTLFTSTDGSRHSGRLALSGAESQPNPAALPSALATARIIEDIGSIHYPEGVKSPKLELNVNAKQGKFRYDRDFLLQFITVCKEKPDSLPPLDALGLEPVQRFPMSRGGPASRRSSSNAMPPRSRHASVGLGISGFNKPAVNPFTMGQFSNQKMTSEERFAWTPASLQPLDLESPEAVDTKVRSLLNKLTMERFDSISDQIIAWANRSEKEKDGRTLIQVIRLIFEKATDEATLSEMYARLCRKMMEQISPNVHDDSIKNAKGKPIGGGQLFHKYLLNCCQEEFERGWVAPEADATAVATKVTEGSAAEVSAEQDEGWEGVLYADESDAAQIAKPQGVGVIRFIGELFKLQMLSGRIMHEWIKKLLGNVESPVEEIERLCTLVTTVGQVLDTPKARAHVDVYFSRMEELTKSPKVNPRIQFMLQDIIELRERKWIPRNQLAAPMTIAGIHEQAAQEKLAQKKALTSMSRGGDRAQVGPDGWPVAGGAAPRPPPKAGDLSKFGKIEKSAPMRFGASSVFQKGDKSKSRESTIRQGNMFSMLSGNPEMASEVAGQSSRPPSRKSSIDLGPGGAPDGAAPPQRRKLQLLPRSVPVENKSESTPAASTVGSEDETDEEFSGGLSLSESKARARIEEDAKEFFSIRHLQEAEVYFTKLPSEHRHLLVDKLVTKAVESVKEPVAYVRRPHS
ncbi:armadillo-type protein, partial [Ganoderma leucocontextum]